MRNIRSEVKYLRILILIISLATLLSGAVQLIRPNIALAAVHANVTPYTMYLFAIIGMFMFLFGALMLHNLYSVPVSRTAVLWCALQKLGASVAVLIGILRGLFGPLAGFISAFDFISAVLFFIFLFILKKTAYENA